MPEDSTDDMSFEADDIDQPMESSVSKKRKRTHSIIEVVEDLIGDIIIKVGTDDDARLIRAHRNVLAMSSPILKTLMASQKPPNVPPRIYTEADPLLLQADDSIAFMDLCNILHQQTIGAQEVPLHRILVVAIVAHKYGCAERMRSWISLPLHEFFGPDLETDLLALDKEGIDVLDAIAIAYVAGDSTLFARATRIAIAKFDHQQFTKNPENALTSLIPNAVFHSILKTHNMHLSQLEEASYQPLLEIYNETPLRNPCQEATERIGLLAFHMCKVKQGHRSFAMTGMSLESVWEAIASVAEVVGAPTSPTWGCEGDFPGCDSGGCTVDVRATLKGAVASDKRHTRGFCLECTIDRQPLLPPYCNHDGINGRTKRVANAVVNGQ